MKERVSVGYGMTPILLVAPHGHHLDDMHTAELTVAAAEEIDASYVVNRGWRRDTKVDQIASRANCNDHRHCLEDVVRQEFLDPINDAILENESGGLIDPSDLFIVCIHGMGNGIRAKANAPKLGAVVGYGEGKPPKYTCNLWIKNCFVDLMNKNICETWEGAPGGDFSARGANNLTQALRSSGTQALQLEIVYAYRDTVANAEKIGREIGQVIKEVRNNENYKRPSSVVVRSI